MPTTKRLLYTEASQLDPGVDLLWDLFTTLMDTLDWRRSAVDTLTSPDGVKLRHHYTNKEWDLTRTAKDEVPIRWTFSGREPLPTTGQVIDFAVSGDIPAGVGR